MYVARCTSLAGPCKLRGGARGAEARTLGSPDPGAPRILDPGPPGRERKLSPPAPPPQFTSMVVFFLTSDDKAGIPSDACRWWR